MYAVFQSGGKQYRVKKGDTVQVELLLEEMGGKPHFKEILLVGSGAEVKVGQPFVTSAAVQTEVVAIEKGPKIIVYHKKRRKQSDKKNGHRQPYTRLLITEIDDGSGRKEILSAEERKQALSNSGFKQGDAWALSEEGLTEAKAAPKKAKAAPGTAASAPTKGTKAKSAPKKAAPKKAN
jgi:large subunit ribosomal protein L21